MSLTSSSNELPRLLEPDSRSDKLPRYAAARSPTYALRASEPLNTPIFLKPSKMAPLMR